MPKLNNPFQPTAPVYPGMFVGRMDEIERIDQILQETKAGNPTNVAIVGEKGIGKTSLLLYIKFLAEGGINSWSVPDETFNFLSISISIDRRTSVGDLARTISTEIRRELGKSKDPLERLSKIWDFVQRLQVGGTKITSKVLAQSDTEIFENLIYSIVDTVRGITEKRDMEGKTGLRCAKDGLVIMIDEANNASNDLDLGTFIKRLSEKLAVEGCNRTLTVIAGLPEVREVLVESHDSALRLFEEFELVPLSPKSQKLVFSKGLDKANKKNKTPVQITPKALDLIVSYSEGYPHFIQQFGYSSYAVDEDNEIDVDDVQEGGFGVGGAIHLIGNRYYRDMYFNKIKIQSYRQVLKIMSKKWTKWVKKSEIRSAFKGKKTTLNNALKALVDRKIILRRPGARGQYRLQWMAFAYWINLIGERIEKEIGMYNST